MAPIYLPRSLRIGAGVLDELPAALAELNLTAPAILTDSFLANSGALDRLLSILGAAGVPARAYKEVIADPTIKSVDAALAFLVCGGHDCIIGFGGGSAIDTAKAVAVRAAHSSTMQALKSPHQENRPGLPIIAIPTTAGTGSEASRFMVVTDDANDEKLLCTGLAYLPTLAIVDYELTLTMPMRLTADTGIDALTHAIEAYISKRANPFSDGMALAAMRAIWPNLRRVCEVPDDRDARSAMMVGSLQAGIAFSNASVALIHGMSRPIGAHFHVSHGLSIAMLLPVVTEWSAPAAMGRYADCARAMGMAKQDESEQATVTRLIDSLHSLKSDLKVPSPSSLGIDKTRWDSLLPLMAEQALISGSPGHNPRIADADTIQDLYRQAWG